MPRIIRVFSARNSYTPVDDYTFIGMPPRIPGMIPEHSEVHVCCVFTWDKAYCDYLAYQWESATNKPVRLGGPAYESFAEGFEQGMYIKSNIIFTTRGCNNQCPWCAVPRIEGKLRELPVCQGNVIQDNNFLQASRAHKDKVFDMLKTQKGICFTGGLEPGLIDDHFCEALNSFYFTRGSKKCSRIAELWLACDTDAALPRLKRAVDKLNKVGFDREKINCYVLIAPRVTTMEQAEARLREIYEAGAMPRCQLYRDFSDKKTEYGTEWNQFATQWYQPAAMKRHMKDGTEFRNYKHPAD